MKPNKGRKIPRDHKISYVLQYRRCGKASCRCNDGWRHGPYWYAEWRDNGRVLTAYVGKEKPGTY